MIAGLAVALQKLLLIAVEINSLICLALESAGAAVAADIAPAAGKGIDGKMTMIAAQTAVSGGDFMLEMLQVPQVPSDPFFLRRAEPFGSGHKEPRHRLPSVRKYPAVLPPSLTPAQRPSTPSFKKVPPCTTICRPMGRRQKPDDFIQSIFHYTDGKPCRDIFNTGSILLRCFTEEFINTVQRDPRSTGRWPKRPRRANSSME